MRKIFYNKILFDLLCQRKLLKRALIKKKKFERKITHQAKKMRMTFIEVTLAFSGDSIMKACFHFLNKISKQSVILDDIVLRKFDLILNPTQA